MQNYIRLLLFAIIKRLYLLIAFQTINFENNHPKGEFIISAEAESQKPDALIPIRNSQMPFDNVQYTVIIIYS